MSVQFKNGDRVRVTKETSSRNSVGDIGIVDDIDYGSSKPSFRVNVPGRDNIGNWHSENSVELLPTPKVDDKVICIKNHTDSFGDTMKVGHEAIIHKDVQDHDGFEVYNLEPTHRRKHQLVKVSEFDEYFKLAEKNTDIPVNQKNKNMTIHSQILAELNLQPGDFVTVTHAVPSGNLGWDAHWVSTMSKSVGQTLKVAGVNYNGVTLADGQGGYNYPAQSLIVARRKSLYTEINISREYTAKIYPGDRIEVGCQTITEAVFNRIKAAFESK